MTVNVDRNLTDRKHYFTIAVGNMVVKSITASDNVTRDREVTDEAEVKSIEMSSSPQNAIKIHRKKGVQKILEALGVLESVVVTEHIVETHNTTTKLVRQAALLNTTEDIMEIMGIPALMKEAAK